MNSHYYAQGAIHTTLSYESHVPTGSVSRTLFFPKTLIVQRFKKSGYFALRTIQKFTFIYENTDFFP